MAHLAHAQPIQPPLTHPTTTNTNPSHQTNPHQHFPPQPNHFTPLFPTPNKSPPHQHQSPQQHIDHHYPHHIYPYHSSLRVFSYPTTTPSHRNNIFFYWTFLTRSLMGHQLVHYKSVPTHQANNCNHNLANSLVTILFGHLT